MVGLEARTYVFRGQVLGETNRDTTTPAVAGDDDVFNLEFQQSVGDHRDGVGVVREDLAVTTCQVRGYKSWRTCLLRDIAVREYCTRHAFEDD